MIDRPLYLDRLWKYKDQNLIKIVTGVRRSGKSTLFALFRQRLLDSGVEPNQIQSINLEDVDSEHLLDYHRLHEHVMRHLVPGKQNYIFLDEIQNVPDFQRAVRSLADKGNMDLYLTGSNSKLQSGEWATSIAGRYAEIHVLPLSFKEFAGAHAAENIPADALFNQYVNSTSFPQILSMGQDAEQVSRYLSDIFNSIVLKDIVANKGIREIARLERVARFLASAVGSEISVKKIADTLTSDGIKISSAVVEAYLQAFADCFLLYRADRYSVKGKKLLKTLNKYYLIDMGFRRLLLGNTGGDSGHILENIVYLELIRRGYRVTVGKVDVWDSESASKKSIEVDFVATTPEGPVYYQVSESIWDEQTRKRELAPLMAIRDHYPKIILTRDYNSSSFDGIQHRNVLEWLLE